MKKVLAGFASISAVLAVAAIAWAASTPTVTVDPLGPLGPYATFPQTVNVTGTVCNTPNVTSVHEVDLWVDNVQEGASYDPNAGNVACGSFSLPWNINGPGTYSIKVTAVQGNETGEDSETVLVYGAVVNVTECPAAPAIAAHYLKDLGVKSNSKPYKNIVSSVAQHMGPQTDFDGVGACDSGYEAAVEAYVDGLLP